MPHFAAFTSLALSAYYKMKSNPRNLILALVAGFGAAAAPEGYTATPAGYIRSDCVHHVEAGAHVEKSATGARVTNINGDVREIPLCPATAEKPTFHTVNQGSESLRGGRKLQFPSDYKGWIEYANLTSPSMTEGFEAFTSVFSTPSLPSSVPDVLYLFPGLQNIDWIPIVDPTPSGPFDIIQPVLQYPGDSGSYWSIKSWWVTLDVGAMASTEVRMQPGDNIFGNMTKIGTEAWYIDTVNMRTGQHTPIKASGLGSRLRSQPWAYVTLECYGCSSCDTYPVGNSSCNFSDMVLTPVRGSPIQTNWQANAKPSRNHFCHESIATYNTTNVNIYFNNP